MNFIVVVFAIFTVSLAACENSTPEPSTPNPSPKPNPNPSKVPDIREVHAHCQNIFIAHIPEEFFKDFGKNYKNALQLPNYSRHIDCMSRNLHLVNDDDTLNPEGVKAQVLLVVPDQSKADSIVQECVQDKDTAWESQRLLWECLYKNNIFDGMKYSSHKPL